jgi:hypothetical protein
MAACALSSAGEELLFPHQMQINGLNLCEIKIVKHQLSNKDDKMDRKKQVLITVEEFKHRYSVSQDNLDFLVKSGEILPFNWGKQTFVVFEEAAVMIGNAIMKADMIQNPHKYNLQKTHH